MIFISCWNTVYSLLMCCRNMTSLQRAAGDPGARPTLEELRQDTREVGFLLFDMVLIVFSPWFVCLLVCLFSCLFFRSVGSSFVCSFSLSVIRSVGRSVERSIGLSIYWSIDLSIYWSFGHSVPWSLGRSVVCSFVRSVVRSIGFSVDWLVWIIWFDWFSGSPSKLSILSFCFSSQGTSNGSC